MTNRVLVPSAREQRIASLLRERCMAEIKQIGDTEEVARLLGAIPVGVNTLVARKEWDLDVAFRVAEGLGLQVVDALERAAG